MFHHAFTSYLTYAHPLDELCPLSCTGKDTFGGLSLSLIDTLDTLIIFEQYPSFVWATRYLRSHLSFDLNTTVSVFETTIRALGGLLSAHMLLTQQFHNCTFDPNFWYPNYDDALLWLAVNLADRLMPAFLTPTLIPYGAIHLQHGVMPQESQIASTAGAGSLLLEFGTLSRLTGDPRYYTAAYSAMAALHSRAAWTGLVGNHINIMDGTWVATDSGVGGLVDSFYEYMAKGYILFGDERLLRMFLVSASAVQSFVRKKPWFLDADMWSGQTSNIFHSSLSAFFPGLQTLMGSIVPAMETTRAHFSVWRKYGCLPEGYNVMTTTPMIGQVNYPLRPELAESLFYLHWATNDPMWIGAAASMLHSLENLTRTPCGYAEIRDVRTHEKGDLMPSFMMSETLKYLFLTFTPTTSSGDPHWLRSGRIVFTTEAHPLPIVSSDAMADIFAAGASSTSAMDNATTSSDSNADGTEDSIDEDVDSIPAHRRKCPLPKEADRIPCGYAMHGTDFPQVVDVNDIPSEGLTADVMRRVERLMREHGLQQVQLGKPGSRDLTRGYRVVQVGGAHMTFQVARPQPKCTRQMGWHVARGLCPWTSTWT